MKILFPRHSMLLRMACLAFFTFPVYAGFQQAISLPGINANDSIVWSALGGDLTALSPPVSSTTLLGSPYTVQGPASLTIFAGSTYNADFLPGDTVIAAFDLNAGNALTAGIEIDLPALVLAIGAQVQVNAFGPFIATMQAFDASSALLGSVTVSSTVNGNGDGTAVFLGGRTTSNPIASIVISSTTPGVAVDTVSLDVAPEPSCLMLAAPALAAFFLRRKRTRR